MHFCFQILNLLKTIIKPIAISVTIYLTIIGAITGITSCGKRRPPLPPSQKVTANTLSAQQQGNRIILKILIPSGAKSLKQINIYRLNELRSTRPYVSEEDYSSRSTLIGAINALSNRENSDAFYSDTLSDLTSTNRLRYAVRLIYTDGRRSALSNFLIIEPNLQISLSPNLSEVGVEQTAIRLEWQKPESNLDQTKPANVAGYNLYRLSDKQLGNPAAIPELLNSTPILETSFADTKFQFGTNYEYFVRAVTSGENDTLIESLNSNSQFVTPRDIFPPTAPQNLTIGVAPNRLSLFFAANGEPDIAGYLIFRTQDEKIPLGEWRKLTAAPLVSTTFQDETVESGQKYYYYLQAIDNNGNISQPSAIVAETVP